MIFDMLLILPLMEMFQFCFSHFFFLFVINLCCIAFVHFISDAINDVWHFLSNEQNRIDFPFFFFFFVFLRLATSETQYYSQFKIIAYFLQKILWTKDVENLIFYFPKERINENEMRKQTKNIPCFDKNGEEKKDEKNLTFWHPFAFFIF